MKAPLATAIVLSAGLAAVPALAASSSSQNMTGATTGGDRVARAKRPIHERPERRGRHAYRAEDARRRQIDPSRGSEVLIEALGQEFAGVLGCDYFSAYRKYRDFGVAVQFCLVNRSAM